MRSRARIWGAVAGLLIMAPIAAAVVFVANLGAEDIRPRLIAAVEHATGRTLTLGSELRFTLSLWPTIEVNQVALANLPGGSRAQMATAERIVLTLSLPALLQHRIELTDLVLVGPNILFEEVSGLPNWRFDLPDPPGAEPATPAEPFELRILGAHVQNGMVTWRLPNRTKVVGIRAADVRHDKPDGSIQLAGTLVYSDYAPFDFKLDARPTGPLAAPWDTRLDFAAFDTVATAKGTMDTAGHYDLQVDGTFGNLDKLNALLPEMRLPAVRGMTLSTRLGNGRQNGDLPVVGATRLQLQAAQDKAVPDFALGPTVIGVDKPGGVATIAGAGRYRSQPFAINGKADIPLYADGPVSLPIDLKLGSGAQAKAAGFDLGLKGKLALRTLAFQGFEGAASLATPALAALRPVAASLPALTGMRLTTQVAAAADLSALTFSGAHLQSAQGELSGSGRIERGAVPKLVARLQSSQLDLDAMLDAFGIDLTPGRKPQGRTVIPDTPIDWSVLRGLALDVATKVAALTFQDETWRDVDLALLLDAGRLRKAALSVQAGGAPVTLSMTADATAKPVPVELSIQAPSLPLALVARYAGLPGRVDGTANVQAHLRATGETLHQLAGTLNGTAAIAAVGGRLDNQAFIDLTGAALTALSLKVPPQGQTTLRCLGVQSSFADGIGRLTTIALETSYLSLEGTGEVDLGHETLSLKIQPLARVSGSLVQVPVTIQGPFRTLSGQLDAGGLDQLGIFVDALFGGDDATACKDAGLLPR